MLKLREQQEILDKLRTPIDQDKIELILSQNYDSQCDICKEDLNTLSLQRIKEHHKQKHNIEDGYIKCCDLKLTTNVEIHNHIQYHLHPNDHKYEVFFFFQINFHSYFQPYIYFNSRMNMCSYYICYFKMCFVRSNQKRFGPNVFPSQEAHY